MPYPGFHHQRGKDKWDEPKPRRPVEDTAGKTENFWTRNVRLITFLICMAVLLAVAGPWSIHRIAQWVAEVRAEQNEVLIPEQEVALLVERGAKLSWQDFEGYTAKVLIEKDMYMCQYDVEGGNYYFWVTSEAKGRPIDSVLLVDVQNDYSEREIKAVVE